jgi:GWxTD domain-containing protein
MFYLAGVLAAAVGAGISWSTEPGDCETGGAIRLEVTLEAEDLLFVSSDGRDRAGYEILATVDDVAYARETGSVQRGELPLTVGLDLADMPPARHEVVVVIVDRETGRSRTVQREILVPGSNRTCWTADDLRIMSGFQVRPGEPLAFEWAVFPPSGDGTADTVLTAYVLRDDDGEAVAEGWMSPAATESQRFRSFEAELDLSAVDPGEYELIAAAIIDEQPVSAVRADIEVLPNWDVWGRDTETTRRNIRPIASASEIQRLEEAGSRSQRQAVMSRFWFSRDPSPGTEENEYLQQYLRRLDYVEERYGVFSIHGAATDMGRVYLLLGEPDLREDHPMEIDRKPYQVWTYFTPSITVVFVDETGYGSYQLATPWEEIRQSVDLPLGLRHLRGGDDRCAA